MRAAAAPALPALHPWQRPRRLGLWQALAGSPAPATAQHAFSCVAPPPPTRPLPPLPPPACLLHRVAHRRRRRRRGIRAPPSRPAFQQHFFRQCHRHGPSFRLGGRGRGNQKSAAERRPRPRPRPPKAARPAYSAAQNCRHSIARQKVCSWLDCPSAGKKESGLGCGRFTRLQKLFGSATAASPTASDTRPCPTWGPGTTSTPRLCPTCQNSALAAA